MNLKYMLCMKRYVLPSQKILVRNACPFPLNVVMSYYLLENCYSLFCTSLGAGVILVRWDKWFGMCVTC